MPDLNLIIASVASFLALVGFVAFIAVRGKYQKEVAKGKKHEEDLSRKIYEGEVLHEISERIGYLPDHAKILEVISGSVGNLIPYSCVSYIVLGKKGEKASLSCRVSEQVSQEFIESIKVKILASFSEAVGEPITDGDVDVSISGAILSDKAPAKIHDYFNVPVVIGDKVIGLINMATSSESVSYTIDNTEVFYAIAKNSMEAVSRLEAVVAHGKARLLAAVQSMADGLFMVDLNFELLIVNKKLTEILGTIANPTLFDIVNALSGKLDLRAKMKSAMSSDLPVDIEEIPLRDKVFQVLISKVDDPKDNKPIGIVVLFHDVTDAKSIEKLRRDFTAMMVHELRSPLTSIRATAEMVLPDVATMSQEDLVKNLKVIDSTSGAMLEVVNDLLDVAKLEAGKFDVVCDDGDVGEAVTERVESIKAQAAEKKLKLTLEIDKDLQPGYFDRIRIKQVLNNLFSNALKYTDRGEIKVGVKQEVVGGLPVDIVVTVADTGIGIEPDQVSGLFNKFKQLKDGRQNAGLKSSGLGLFIAKGIVSAWGGKIWGESKGVGMGSAFYFTIPCHVPAPKQSEKADSDTTGPVVTLNKVAQA